MKTFHAIAAIADNRVIGNGADIPWHLPDDFRWFKEKTLGHAIVMGRKTYESIGRPLPKRKNIVITRQELEIEGCDVIHSLDELATLELEDRETFIIGGGQIYQTALPRCSDLWISHIKGDFTGDAFFPEFESSFEEVETIRNYPDFRVVHYQRKTT